MTVGEVSVSPLSWTITPFENVGEAVDEIVLFFDKSWDKAIGATGG